MVRRAVNEMRDDKFLLVATFIYIAAHHKVIAFVFRHLAYLSVILLGCLPYKQFPAILLKPKVFVCVCVFVFVFLRHYRHSPPLHAAVRPVCEVPLLRRLLAAYAFLRSQLSLQEWYAEGLWLFICLRKGYLLTVGVRHLPERKILQLCMRQCCPEAEEALRQRMQIYEVHEAFAVDDVPHPTVNLFQLYVIPMVGLYHVHLVGVFPQYGRTVFRLLDTPAVTVIPAETCCLVIVAAVAHVVHRLGVVIYEAARLCAARCHPEAVQVRHPFVAHDAGIVLYHNVSRHLLSIPQRQPARRMNISHAVAQPLHVAVLFSLHTPTLRSHTTGRKQHHKQKSKNTFHGCKDTEKIYHARLCEKKILLLHLTFCFFLRIICRDVSTGV